MSAYSVDGGTDDGCSRIDGNWHGQPNETAAPIVIVMKVRNESPYQVSRIGPPHRRD